MVQVFDKHNRGYISASDLRAVLQCLGEDLSEEESKYHTAHPILHCLLWLGYVTWVSIAFHTWSTVYAVYL